MADCKVCGGAKLIRGMGGMKEKCKACGGTGKQKVEPVVIAKKTFKKKETING